MDRWKDADANRDLHDEYLEWTVKKNEDGDITSVTFTCEGPEVIWPPSNAASKTNIHPLLVLGFPGQT